MDGDVPNTTGGWGILELVKHEHNKDLRFMNISAKSKWLYAFSG